MKKYILVGNKKLSGNMLYTYIYFLSIIHERIFKPHLNHLLIS